MGSSMKVHQFARGFWVHEPSSLTLPGCNRLRPLVPKLANTVTATSDLKSFITPETDSGSTKLRCSEDKRSETTTQVEAQPGGTRWNPTQEQIGILEMLYRGGMRTPNAQQIEQITVQLGKYGKIEGKNVFYWFQNHKARERQRQRQKRNNTGLGLGHYCPTTSTPATTNATKTLDPSTRGQGEREEDSPYKRKWRSWGFECLEEDNKRFCKIEEGDKTLELFPLHPESR